MKLHLNTVSTEIAPLTVCAENDYIIYLGFGTSESELRKYFSRFLEDIEFSYDDSDVITQLKCELSEYFGKKRFVFDVKYKLYGTEFRKNIWHELEKIPYGAVRSYGEIAKSVGLPKSARAVGGANHNNPVSIIVPCHRVIGANGNLTGYGGGLSIKEYLLKLEGVENLIALKNK